MANPVVKRKAASESCQTHIKALGLIEIESILERFLDAPFSLFKRSVVLRSRPTELDGTFRPRFVKPVAPTELPTQITSTSARDIFERFDFATQIEKLAKCNLLYQVTEKFAGIDLHPDVVSNNQMGLAFEDLIRKFAELSNETAGEHFTTREVIRLMVNLLFIEDGDVLSKPGVGRPR
jgi:hypothetical protein